MPPYGSHAHNELPASQQYNSFEAHPYAPHPPTNTNPMTHQADSHRPMMRHQDMTTRIGMTSAAGMHVPNVSHVSHGAARDHEHVAAEPPPRPASPASPGPPPPAGACAAAEKKRKIDDLFALDDSVELDKSNIVMLVSA